MIVELTSLWLPILLSAIAVFIVSSLIWTVVQWHNGDWHKLPNEEAARQALSGTPPGEYTIPHAADGKARRSEEWQARYKEGPAVMMTVLPHGSLGMGKQLGQWIVYTLLISFVVAYLAAATLNAGADYLKVFQVTGTAAWLGYAGATIPGSVWFGHGWGRTVKEIIDGLVYALLTAGIFGWLWP